MAAKSHSMPRARKQAQLQAMLTGTFEFARIGAARCAAPKQMCARLVAASGSRLLYLALLLCMQAHKKVLMELDETNKRRVLDKNGEYVTSHTFEEAFPHHVHFTMCRARGIFAGKLVNRPEFRDYVRGLHCPMPLIPSRDASPHEPPPPFS